MPPVEIVSRRTRNGKVFQIADGRFRTVANAGAALHWNDGATWRDVDLAWVLQENGRYEVKDAPYLADFDPQTYTLRYRSRTLGDMRVRLVSIDGAAPTPVVPEMFSGDERMRSVNIGAGVSLVVAALDSGVEIFRRLTGPTLPTIVWEIEESESIGVVKTNILQMIGRDNDDGSAAARASEALYRNKRRFVEIDTTKDAEIITAGRRRYTVAEILTGRTRWRDPETRAPEWRNEIAFPIFVDVQIVETVGAEVDDGFAYPAGASEGWESSGDYVYFDQQSSPAWRFQTVDVPQGAIIDSAVLRVNVVNAGDITAALYGENVDDASAWADTSANGPNRMTRTTASITFDSFTSTGFHNKTVTTLVQEIVNRGGWVANNDMRLGCTDATAGSDLVKFDSFDYVPSNAGRLTIDYTVGGSVIPVFTRQYRARAA